MSKVIILGAGSSKECGLPLGNEVFGDLEYNDGPAWYHFMNEIFPQSAIGVRCPAFETVLSLVDGCIKNQQSLGRYSSHELAKVRESLINSYVEVFKERCPYAVLRFSDCSLMPDAGGTYDNFQWYEAFFNQSIKEENDVAIISINYDILIDFVLYKMIEGNKDINYGFEHYNLFKQTEKLETNGTLLLKPHGSINFAKCDRCGKIFTGFPIEDNRCDSCKINLKILIIPPTYNKNYQSDSMNCLEEKAFKEINQKISEVISKATEILIIGYSLPDYDLNIMKAFLEGALRNENRLKLNVEIITKEEKEEEIKSKYVAIFNRSVQYYGKGFKEYAREFNNSSHARRRK